MTSRPAEQSAVRAAPELQPGLFGLELVRAPAMVMAMGIWLMFAGPYELVDLQLGGWRDRVAAFGTVMMVLLSTYIAYSLIRQWRLDPTVIWSKTADHFAIGTWVAGVNVLARVLHDYFPLATVILASLGTILWVVYLSWIVRAVRDRALVDKVNGTVFLPTVATQSLVLAWIVFWPHPPVGVLAILMTLSLLGLIAYCGSFWMFWIRRGPLVRLRNWVPPNNITHGSLSISSLAATVLCSHLVEIPIWVRVFLGGLWIAAAVQIALAFCFELWLLVKERRPLWRHQMGNYARNFTYGMFFSCTFEHTAIITSANVSWGPILQRSLGLAILAAAATLLNIWEYGRHAVLVCHYSVIPSCRRFSHLFAGRAAGAAPRG